MIALILIACSILFAGAVAFRNRNKASDSPLSRFGMPIAIVVVGILVALFQPYSVQRVDAGHVGIKVNLTGNDRGVSDYQYKTGWVVINTWTEQLYEYPTFQQHVEYDNISVITKGGFSADIKPSFNYTLVPDAIGDMFSNLRVPVETLEQGWLKNAIYSSVNDVANRWAVDSIFNNREQFETAIITECNKRVSVWFTVSQLRSNIVPPQTLQEAIVAKTKSIQNVQVAENNKAVAIAEGETKVATARMNAEAQIVKARGDSASTVIAAQADAEAIKKRQMTITPLYIEYLKAYSWNGVLPTVTGGSTPMIQLK